MHREESIPSMSADHRTNTKDPLEGKTLKAILTELYEHFGWNGLARQISINCFKIDPSITSSLKFLRKTPWARSKLEKIYFSFIQGKRARDLSIVGAGCKPDALEDPDL